MPDEDNTIPRPGEPRATAETVAASDFGRATGAAQRAATQPPPTKAKAEQGTSAKAKAAAPAKDGAANATQQAQAPAKAATTDGADASASGSAARSRGPGPVRDAKAIGASQPPPSSGRQAKDGPDSVLKPALQVVAPLVSEPALDSRIFERIIEDVAVLSAQQYRLLRRHLARHPHAGNDRHNSATQASVEMVEQETQVEDTPPLHGGLAAQAAQAAGCQASAAPGPDAPRDVGIETHHLPQHPLHPQELERMRAATWPCDGSAD